MAAAFVGFALASSFWFSRARPEFPGRGLKLFVGVSILLTIGMLTTVIAVAKEKKEKGAAPETTTTPAQPAPPGPTPPPAPAAKGDPAKGKALFDQNGWGSCHTYGPAGPSGKVGPDPDKVASDAQKAGQPPDAY